MFRSDEQQKFHDRVALHLAGPQAPLLLEGATGLGKTRAYLSAAFASGQKIAICFPTHALIDQLLSSSDLALMRDQYPNLTVSDFRPKTFFEDEADYKNQKARAMASDIMLCTSTSVIFDQRLKGDYNGVTLRDAILFDEADMLPDLAALTSEMAITRQELKDLGINHTRPVDIVEALLERPNLDQETKAKARLAREVLAREDRWFHKCGMTKDGDLAVYSQLAGRLIKKISNRPSSVFMSATLSIGGTFRDFQRSMGIEKVSGLSENIEPKTHGTLHYDFYLDHKHETPEWLSTIVEQAQDATTDGRVLIITPSHRLAREIGEKLSEAVVREPSETTAEAASRMGNRRLMVAAGAWAGLDVPEPFQTIIFPTVPYSRPKEIGEEWLEDAPDMMVTDQMSSYLDSRNAAIRRLIQGQGRGLRSPDAFCRIVFCDPRIVDLGESYIPKRFKGGFFEGRKVSETSNKAERNPRLRRDALKHHGTECQADCASAIRHLRQLEVHHMNPLADRGEGITKLEDVAVLCRNCHGLAHKDGNNVLSLDQLKAFAAEDKTKLKRRLATF